jgi:subtilisin family serine protease
MSTPHVTGVTALLFQVNPRFNPAQIREILTKSAQPRNPDGSPGQSGVWNPVYGFGRMDAYAAVHLAMRVSAMAESLNLSPWQIFSELNKLFSTPDDLAIRQIVETGKGTLLDDITYPTAFEGTDWVAASEIWK